MSTNSHAQFGQIMRDGDGVFLVLDGNVYLGKKEDKQFVFTWRDFANNETEVTSKEGDYRFNTVEHSSVTTTYTLEFSGKDLKGTRSITASQEYTASEVDEWDTALSNVNWSNLQTWQVLANGGNNRPGFPDCSSSTCEVGSTFMVTTTGSVKGSKTGLDPSGFDGIKGVEQGNSSFYGGYDSDWR